MERNFPLAGQLDMALTRINQQSQVGFGEIARIRVIMVDDLTAKGNLAETLTMNLQNVYIINKEGESLPFTLASDSVVVFQEDNSTALTPDWFQQIQLYPNPASSSIELELNSLTAQQLQVYSLAGQVLIEEHESFQHKTLDLTTFNEGVYLIRVQTNKGWYQQKFFIH